MLIPDPILAAKVADLLLDAQAVRLSPDKPFTWASGWRSPIYCDNRVVLSHPAARTAVRDGLAQTLTALYGRPDVVVGVATGAIAQGALVADVLGLPFAYVRPKAKEHGLGNRIEGRVDPGMRVVVIEDLISTGGSSLAAVDALRSEAGAQVVGMVAVFTYGFATADAAFAAAACPVACLSDYDALLQRAVGRGTVDPQQMDSLSRWRSAPAEWGRS
jgi:orotate phosphoribosyltransferase